MIYNHHNHHDCFNSSRHREETQCLDNNLMFVSIIHISTFLYTYLSHACIYLCASLSISRISIYLLGPYILYPCVSLSIYHALTQAIYLPTSCMYLSISISSIYTTSIIILTRPIYPCIYVSIPSSIQPLSDNWSKPHDNSLCGLPHKLFIISQRYN